MKLYKYLSAKEKLFAPGAPENTICACIIHEQHSAMKVPMAYTCDVCDDIMVRSFRPLWKKFYDWIFNY